MFRFETLPFLQKNLPAHAVGQSKIGRLGDDFNHMLEAIEQRGKELREAPDLLEERISERTMALEQEIAERQKAEMLAKESGELFRALNEASTVEHGNLAAGRSRP